MVPAGTPVAIALDGAAVALLGWTSWAAFRDREKPSGPPFVALAGTLAVWAVFALGSELPGAPSRAPLRAAWGFGQLAAALVLPGVWTVYALGYAGRGTGLTRRRVAMLAGIALPVVGTGVVLATGPSTAVAERAVASFLGTEILYLFVLFSYATYLLVGLGRSHSQVSNRQIAVLTLAAGGPYLGSLVREGGGAADGVTVGLLASGGLLAVAIRRYPVMTGFPKADYVARTRVVEALREAVVVLDWNDRVLDANATAAELFGGSAAGMVGEPIRAVVDGLAGTDLSTGTTGAVTLRTTKGRRQFQYSVSVVDGTGDERNPVARAVVFRDVTDRQTREQRLTVLDRVLRHNVRNELDVILAHAERIDDETLRTGIRESATDLAELSEKARDAEEIMTASAEPPEPVDLAAVAATVAEWYRTADGELSVSAPDELVVPTHRTVVERVLSELVENALAHAGDSPRVEISVRAGPEGTAELAVADDGPGIPERERAVLADGTETQLEHGQGVGLWLVSWAVTQLGGDLDFAENDPEGSVVTVRLPGAAGEP